MLPRSALNATRQQLFSQRLTAKVRRAHPDDEGVRLAVTDFDLYKTSHRFIFGDGDEAQGVAAVSLHRLRSEFYGEAADATSALSADAQGGGPRARPRVRPEALLQRALRDVLFQLDLRNRQQDLALLRDLRPPSQPRAKRTLAQRRGRRRAKPFRDAVVALDR